MKHFVICSVLYKNAATFLDSRLFMGWGCLWYSLYCCFVDMERNLGASDGHCMHWAFIGDNKVYICVNFCHLLSNIDHSCQQFTSHSKLQWCHVAHGIGYLDHNKAFKWWLKNTAQYCHWDILIRFRIGPTHWVFETTKLYLIRQAYSSVYLERPKYCQ